MRTNLYVTFRFIRPLVIFLCKNEEKKHIVFCTEKDFEVETFNQENFMVDHERDYFIYFNGFEGELNELFSDTLSVGKPWVEDFYESENFREGAFKMLLLFSVEAFYKQLLSWTTIRERTDGYKILNLVNPSDFDLLITIDELEVNHEGNEVFTCKQIAYDTKEKRVVKDDFK
jgi:hypothetical protein